MYDKDSSGAPGRSLYKEKEQQHRELCVKTVLFLEQTPEGGLSKMMREMLRSMEPALDFKVKVVERPIGGKFNVHVEIVPPVNRELRNYHLVTRATSYMKISAPIVTLEP